jgi:hypothetical protein
MWRFAVAGVFGLAVPATVQAEEVSFSFGATVASEYVSNGLRYTDGVAIQPYVELGYAGFYAGAYTTNTEGDLTFYDRETGFSLGYRGEAGSFSYDVSLNYYVFDETFEDVPIEDYAEAVFSGTVAASETFYVTGEIGIAPEYDQTDVSLRVDYYTPVEGLSLDATVGSVDANYASWDYWSVGANYAVNETVGFGLAYHDSNATEDAGTNTDGLFVASVNIAFSFP